MNGAKNDKRSRTAMVACTVALCSTGVYAQSGYTRTDLLNYLNEVSAGSQIISGQHIRAGDAATYQYYRHNVQEIHEQTTPPVWVGVYSSDLGIFIHGALHEDPPWFSDYMGFHSALKEYYDAGGIIDLCAHTNNPEGGDSWTSISDLRVLTDSTRNPAAYGTFWGWMSEYADYFDLLKNDGIPVLWRPFHEMNGGWFWWGDDGNQDWGTRLAELWRRMHDYFTVTRGLDNLLWVFAPDGQTNPGNALVPWPGDEYVDIVGIDFYNKFSDPDSRALALTAWNLLKTKNKAMAITEMGPFTFGNPSQAGSYDYYNDFLVPVLEYLPEACYFVPWYEPWCPVDNVNANQLYQDPSVLNRDELNIGVSTTLNADKAAVPAMSRGEVTLHVAHDRRSLPENVVDIRGRRIGSGHFAGLVVIRQP